LNKSSAKWVPENTIIVAMYGATAGKSAITKIPLTTNQACCNLIIDEHLADYRYVYYYLYSKYEHIASLANGGAQQNLNAGQIKEYLIDLPSLDIQQKVADILESLDNKIEQNKQINDNLSIYRLNEPKFSSPLINLGKMLSRIDDKTMFCSSFLPIRSNNGLTSSLNCLIA